VRISWELRGRIDGRPTIPRGIVIKSGSLE
jgi:hypothetical protein